MRMEHAHAQKDMAFSNSGLARFFSNLRHHRSLGELPEAVAGCADVCNIREMPCTGY
jgi:hypothetical protein